MKEFSKAKVEGFAAHKRGVQIGMRRSERRDPKQRTDDEGKRESTKLVFRTSFEIREQPFAVASISLPTA